MAPSVVNEFGVGANAYRSFYRFEEFDALVIEFVDTMGESSTASHISILLSEAGIAGNVVVTTDNGAPGAPIAATPGGSIDIDQTGVHKIKVEVPGGEDSTIPQWESLTFDRDCL